MEDEDIAPDTYRKSHQYNYIPVPKYSGIGMTLCQCRLEQLYLYGAISSVFHFAPYSIQNLFFYAFECTIVGNRVQ